MVSVKASAWRLAIIAAATSAPAAATVPVIDYAVQQALIGPDVGIAFGTPMTVKGAIVKGYSVTVSAIESASKSIIKAMGDLADAVAVVDTARTKTQDVVRIIGEYEMPPSAAPSAGASEAARLARAGNERNASVFSAQLVDRLLNASPQRGADASLFDAYADYAKQYDPRKSGQYANADVMGETLLAGAGKPGKPADHTFSNDQIAAAQRFILNAVNLTPLPTLTETQIKTEDGRRYIALSRAEMAKTGIALKSYIDYMAWKTPIDGLPDKVGQMWRAMATAVTPNGSVPNKLSFEGFLINEVERRYANPGWYVAVAEAAPAALQREALFMQAMDLRLKLVMIEQNRKIELLLAQQLLNNQPNSQGRKDALVLHQTINR